MFNIVQNISKEVKGKIRVDNTGGMDYNLRVCKGNLAT